MQNGIRITMTINGDPLENLIAERVNGIVKNEYQLTFEHVFKTLENKITQAIFHYNNYRQHLSIDNLTPSVAHQLNGCLKRQWKTNYKKINSSNEA
jgi:transposase InsO family protein